MRAFGVALLLAFAVGGCGRAGPNRILVFTKTDGFRHSSIDVGKAALLALGAANDFAVDTTESDAYFNDDSLANYGAVVFLHTTGNILERRSEIALQRYIEAGGGFVGIHAAADAEYDNRWYGRLVGAYFLSHPAVQTARLRVENSTHESTRHLTALSNATWERRDEWYDFQRRTDSLQVLLTIDESSYEGGRNGPDHPMAWYHEVDGGRAWYTALGHTEESFSDTLFLQHVLGGIRYAMSARADYARAQAAYPPADSQFVKEVLTTGTLTEPTEMAVLPNSDVLIAQRGGEVLLFRDADRSLSTAATLSVYSKSGVEGVNAEEGLLGIALDPDFAANRFVYLFYSPTDTSVNRLSRFEFDGDSILLSTERVVLQFYSQRQICCHTGGSLAFGADRLLHIATGDNATPFDEKGQRYPTHGFSPLDDRPGHEQYDARRTSANTNDLRGKVLRIRVLTDGTYEIPPGNLFAPGTPNTRPEIYVMGTRNAYRLSVDRATSYVYWGDVGPDAPNDSLAERGPRGYDEVNQARQAGNFGWPLFIGENHAYREWDYATGRSGAAFDPLAPQNTSRNNTGLRTLPPAQRAFIAYPYAKFSDFPQLGSGSRTAMAGPVVRRALIGVPHAQSIPEYYDGKLFIYDWIRHWVFAVTMAPNGDYVAMERFLPTTKFAAPIDMELGPDGRLYVLEYGIGWFTKNPDAGLARVVYRPSAQ
jgi:glucose/arabinose dehydrogenase